MNRVRQPFNVNHLAMVAACAALATTSSSRAPRE
jgi:histidinol-phosphate/aromatic aminotransferase/cobyric acid decarboxylase-like protein